MTKSKIEIPGWVFSIIGMVIVTIASNFLVEIPISDWLTWGAFTYPFTFFITELTNCFYGSKKARQVVYVGFFIGISFGILMMNKRIAFASSFAFLVGQLLDIYLFSRLRRGPWWKAPTSASITASFLDAAIFFSCAFMGQDIPWISLALGDFGVKLTMDLLLLLPFRLILNQRLKQPTRWSLIMPTACI